VVSNYLDCIIAQICENSYCYYTNVFKTEIMSEETHGEPKAVINSAVLEVSVCVYVASNDG
jgi:hypothetical protein